MDDFILDEETGDLLIRNGDFVVGNGNDQHMNDIIQTVPGEWKESPFLGCDLYRFTNANVTTSEVVAIVKKQLEIDLFTVNNIDVILGENITVYANAEK